VIPADPFAIKSIPKWHPLRLARTAAMRFSERMAARQFDQMAIPNQPLDGLSGIAPERRADTDVTANQMQHLLAALRATEHLQNTAIVEVGCFRGVSTREFALATSRKLIGVDPFIGYGGSDEDYRIFQKNTEGVSNFHHERRTSGEAFRHWAYGPISFAFIDAVHDYANTSYDLAAWSSLLVSGGMVALHDTDNRQFAGTRKAAAEGLKTLRLYAHIPDLTILSKP